MATTTGNTIFTALESAILEHGERGSGEFNLSELSVIEGDGENTIAFQFIGSAFLLTPDGAVVSVDGSEDSPEIYALEGSMRSAVLTFLKLRLAFIREFQI